SNHIHCFNHTLQLLAKMLLKPFHSCLRSKKATSVFDDGDNNTGNANAGNSGDGADNDNDNDGDDEEPGHLEADNDSPLDGEDEDKDDGGDGEEDEDDPDDGIDELEELGAESEVKFIQDTKAIREMIDKLAFVIIHLSTKLLPSWRSLCIQQKRKPCLIPCDVVTQWNSTYNMLRLTLNYRAPIDAIMADKSLKLRKYELDDIHWKIVGDLVSVLEVMLLFPF
ncbi:hypothetical protein L208DRAFT_1239312, partial [Tricholoma matsutake]